MEPAQLLSHTAQGSICPGWRVHHQVGEGQRQAVSQRASLFAWDDVSLGVGRARCFLKMANQLPRLSCAPSGPTSQPIPLPQDGLQARAQHLLLPPLCLSSPTPPPVW